MMEASPTAASLYERVRRALRQIRKMRRSSGLRRVVLLLPAAGRRSPIVSLEKSAPDKIASGAGLTWFILNVEISAYSNQL